MADLKSSVHGKQEYMDLDVFFSYIQVFVLFSYFYVAVTFGIVYKMCRMYYTSRVFNKTTLVHGSLFESFLWMQMANFSFFVFDNLVFRLPSTGLLTSLCAPISPSHFLKVLYMLQLLTSYSSMFYSLLFCVTRLVIIFFPDRHRKISSQIVFFFVPFTFIFPPCADFYLLPAEGYCRQLGSPYPFGSISVSFTDTWFDIRTDRCMLYLSFITPATVILVNAVLIYKVRSWLFHKKMTRSQKSRRAQISLTMTTLAISIQFLASGGKTVSNGTGIQVVGLIAPDFGTYALLIRNPLIDFGMVLVPWLFYLSHPMFHERSGATSSIT